MAYVDRHLEEGEQVLFRTRLHPVMFAGAIGLAGAFALVGALIIRHNDLARETNRQVAAVAAGLVVAAVAPAALRWRTADFAVTDRRVVLRPGIRRGHTVELSGAEMDDVDIDQTAVARLFGYGTLHVSGSGGGAQSFSHVAHVHALRDAMTRLATSGRRRPR